jgi:hypothetical protein
VVVVVVVVSEALVAVEFDVALWDEEAEDEGEARLGLTCEFE